jgi:hypothetical protein
MNRHVGFSLAALAYLMLSSSEAPAAPHAVSIDRASALNLLATHGLPPFTVKLPIGDDVHMAIMIQGVQATNANYAQELDAGYGASQQLGYLSFNKRTRNMFGNIVESYDIRPTPLGLQNGGLLHEDFLGYSTEYDLLLAERIPVAITGIQTPDPEHRSIEFQYRLNEGRPVFKAMVPGGDGKVRTGTATATRYDDGWRITDVQVNAN